MAQPDNLSLKGICDWARTVSSQAGQNPVGQDINADMVDGKHYSQLKSEWEAYAATAGGGGGVVAMGSALFVGNGSYRTITFTPTLPSTTYAVYIIPDAATSSRVGEFWVASKTTSSFRIYNAGTGQTSFQWAVAVLGQMPDLAGPASGDISGSYPGPITVAKLQGRNVVATAPSTGQVLAWNGSSWAPAAAASGSGLTKVILFSGSTETDSSVDITLSQSYMTFTFLSIIVATKLSLASTNTLNYMVVPEFIGSISALYFDRYENTSGAGHSLKCTRVDDTTMRFISTGGLTYGIKEIHGY